jgi:hypothetical protein
VAFRVVLRIDWSLLDAQHQKARSSAKRVVFVCPSEVKISGRSLIKMLNNRGLITVPCGNPVSLCLNLDIA